MEATIRNWRQELNLGQVHDEMRIFSEERQVMLDSSPRGIQKRWY